MIKKIVINEIGNHKKTELLLGAKNTFVFAPNGTGKTTMSHAIDINEGNYNKELIFEEDKSYVVLHGDRNKKNTILLKNNEILYDSITSKFKPTTALFSESIWGDIYKKNILGKSIREIPLARERHIELISKNRKEMLSYRLKNFDKILTCKPINRKKEIIEKVEWKIVFRKLIRRGRGEIPFKNSELFLQENKDEIYKLFKQKNEITISKETKHGISMLINNFLTFAQNNDKKLKRDFKTFSRFIMWIVDFTLTKIHKEKINISRALIIWFPLHFIASIREITNLPNFAKEDIENQINKLENELGKFRKSFEKNKAGREEIVKKINKYISVTHLAGKFKLNNMQEIKSVVNNSAIVISTGELKFIYLMLFILSNLRKDLIILDDPISSMDSQFIDYFMEFLRIETKNSKCQFLIFTHNENIFREFYKTFKNAHNKKTKKYIDKNRHFTFSLGSNGKVITKEIHLIENRLKRYHTLIKDENFSDEIRMFYSRKFFEEVASFTNRSDIAALLDVKYVSKIALFGNKYNAPLRFQKWLNRWAHSDEIINDSIYSLSGNNNEIFIFVDFIWEIIIKK